MGAGDLQRLDIGAVLKRSLGLLGGRFPLYFGIVALPAMFLAAIGLGIVIFTVGISAPASKVNPIALWRSMNWLPKAVIIFSFLAAIALLNRAWVATVHATSELELGHRISLAQAYGRVHRKSLRLLWLLYVIGVLTGPLSLLLGPLAIVFFLPAVPTAALEGQGARESLSRSSTLMEGNRLRVFLLILLYFLALIAMFGSIAVLAPIPGLSSLPAWARPVMAFPMFCLLMLPTQWVFIALTLLYRNLRASRPGDGPTLG